MNVKKRIALSSRVFGVHFLLSGVVAALVFFFPFKIWFPWPYGELTGGYRLYTLIFLVDIVLGPFLTLVLYDPRKSSKEKKITLSLIAFAQTLALIYGVWALSLSRPVYIAFEKDRLRVVAAREIDTNQLVSAPAGLKKLSWSGPVFIGLREPRDSNEFLKSLERSIAGEAIAVRPNWWKNYSDSLLEIRARAKSFSDLIRRAPEKENEIREKLKKLGVSENETIWLPLTSDVVFDWVILLEKKDGKPLIFIRLDGF